MESFEFTGDVFFPSPNSGVQAEEFRQLRQDEMRSNDNDGTQQTVLRPDTSVTSYDFNDRDVSASSAAQYQQMPTNYLPFYTTPASAGMILLFNNILIFKKKQSRAPQAQTPVTTAADDDGRTTLPAALRRLLQLLKSSTNGPQKSTEVVALLRNNPQLMAAFIQQRNILANKPNPPCVVANPQQQVGASNGNSTTIATHQTLQVTGNICSTTQQRMMTGGTMIVAQPPPQISRSSDFPATIHQQSTNQLDNLVVASSYGHVSHLETRSSTGSPVNINQCSRSAIDLPPNQENGGRRDIGKRVGSSGVANWVVASQLAVARQLIMQAAISVAAAGATNFSQILNDQTHSIEHVMKVHCPTFPHGQMQMEAILSLTPLVNSQLSAPKIPTCSICLDQLVSTVVFPCRHFFCETCAPKI